MRQFLSGYDVLACPTVSLEPGPVIEEYPKEIDGQPLEDYIEWLRFSFLSTTGAYEDSYVTPLSISSNKKGRKIGTLTNEKLSYAGIPKKGVPSMLVLGREPKQATHVVFAAAPKVPIPQLWSSRLGLSSC